MTASTSAHYNRIINLLATEVKKELIYFDFQSMGSWILPCDFQVRGPQLLCQSSRQFDLYVVWSFWTTFLFRTIVTEAFQFAL